MCTVTIDMPVSTPFDSQSSPKKSVVGISADNLLSVTLGSVVVSKGAGWSDLEEKLNTVFLNHISEVSVGLRTKKTSRFDQDWPDPPSPLTLGISLNSVKYFSIGKLINLLTCTKVHSWQQVSLCLLFILIYLLVVSALLYSTRGSCQIMFLCDAVISCNIIFVVFTVVCLVCRISVMVIQYNS